MGGSGRGAPVERIARWPIGKLLPYAGNPKTHPPAHVELIAKSMARFGQAQIVLVDEGGEIIAGHGRVLAAQSLGWTELVVGEAVGWSEDEKRAYRIADNQLGSELLAPWDMALLKPELASLSMGGFDMAVLGFDNMQLKQFFAGKSGEAEPDEVPEPLTNPVSIRGDLWALENHRLLCGDSGIRADVERLRNGVQLEVIVTDPPYSSGGRQDGGKRNSTSIGTRSDDRIARDNLTTKGYLALMANVLSNVDVETAYVFTDWRMWTWTYDALEGSGYPVRNMLVWDKNRMGMGFPWRSQHELIAFAKRGAASMNDGKAGNVIQCNRSANELHPTQKPVELMERLIANTPGDVIIDPFVGSGTTLIAAQTIGRQFFGIEIDPGYADVCVRRWQNFTGKKAILDGDGRDFDTIKAERLSAAGRLQPVDRGSVPGDPGANGKRRAAVGAEGKGRR